MGSKTSLLMFYASSLTLGIEIDGLHFQRNFYLSSKGYLSISGIGLYGCARYCGMDSGCKSFTYNPTDLRCRLIEDDANIKPENFGASYGYIYGDRATVISEETLMGSCHDYDCPAYSTCVRLSSGSRVCVVTACGPTTISSNRGHWNADDVSDTVTPLGLKRYLSCDAGYTGYKSVVCLASGNWSEPKVNCIDCVIVSSMQNAFTTATVAPAGTTVSYTCDVGYVLASGTGNRHCNTQGSWEVLDILCDPVNCGLPITPFGVTGYSFVSLTYQSIITFFCQEGYISTNPGNMEITCQSDGNWSLPQFQCILT